MTGKLTSYVHLPDGRVFGPDDQVPAEAAALITNPAAWEGGVPPAPSHPRGAQPDSLPPRGGAGSGTDAWLAYAAAHRIEVPGDATRDQVIAAVEAAAAAAPAE